MLSTVYLRLVVGSKTLHPMLARSFGYRTPDMEFRVIASA
jgi:hypothetical protein